MKIAFLLYPTTHVKVGEDTSFWIMFEMLRRGHEVFHFESRHLFWQAGEVQATLTASRLDPRKGFLPSSVQKEPQCLSTFQCIFIRKEPPFDNEYLWALHLLELVKDRVFVINDPQGIAMSNEKLFTLFFKKYSPESCATEDVETACRFIQGLRSNVVVKPLHEKGGAGIFFTSARDKNLRSLLSMATEHGKIQVLLQRYVPAERFGDKRILILDGQILGAFLRRPPPYDFRANLSLGASLHKTTVTAQDRRLVEELAPELAQRGLLFVGIDVIGRFLTEINVTSPAGIPDLNLLYKTRVEKKVADYLEKRS